MAVEVRTEGPTPAGGTYAIARFTRDGEPADQAETTDVEISEYAADDRQLRMTYGTLSA